MKARIGKNKMIAKPNCCIPVVMLNTSLPCITGAAVVFAAWRARTLATSAG